MNSKQLFTKMLLVALCLIGGGNALWAGTTKTITLYPTGDTDPTKAAAWVCQFTPTEGDGYISFAHSGSGQREAYLKFYNTGSDIYAEYDTYTVSFDYYTYRGFHHDSKATTTPQVAFYAEGASVGNSTSNFTDRNTTAKNYLMLWSNTVQQLDARTMYVNGSDTENFTSPQAGWARATITVTKSTGNVTYSVTSLDGNTTYLPEGSYTATGDGTSANCQGIYFSFGRLSGQEVRVNNVKVTTVIEIDEVTDPSASVSSVNTTSGERTLAVTDGVSDNDGSVTTYWSASTELTESNYSSAGTAVVSNTITTTSDVVYLISISTKGGNSNCVTYNVADNVRLKAPSVALKSVTHNDGTLESPVFTINATANTDVVGTPTSTLYYTFTPNGGSESARTAISDGGTYSPTAYGTLKVYATAIGYTENVYSIPVSDYYYSDYSTDYTAYTENPFGSSETTSSAWWTGATAYKSTASSATTLGRLRFGNNTVTHLVIGYGVGRPDNNCSVKIRKNKLGNIQTLTIKNNNSSGVTSGTFYHDDLGTSGSGKDTDLTSEYYVPTYNTVAKHNCYVPAENPVIAAAIADCKTYETSSTFAEAIDAETNFASAADVYAFHSAWQIAQAQANSSTDYSKAIMNRDFELGTISGWTIYGDPADTGDEERNNGKIDATNAIDGSYSYYTGDHGRNVSQNIATLPAGVYQLTAHVGSWSGGAPVRLFANGTLSAAENGEDHTPSLIFTVTGNEESIKVGIGGTGNNDDTDNTWGTWGYRVDNFTLTKIENVSKTITSAGWATYCSPYILDFTNDIENLTDAYIVTGGAGGKLVTSSVKGKKVPANTGLLLKGLGACVIPVATTSDEISGNKLTGVTTATPIAAEAGYVLMNGSKGVAFYKNANAFTVGANTAYLPANFATTTTPGARAFFSFGDDATDIRLIENGKMENSVYDLQGRRIDGSRMNSGIYIHNGRKVFVK